MSLVTIDILFKIIHFKKCTEIPVRLGYAKHRLLPSRAGDARDAASTVLKD